MPSTVERVCMRIGVIGLGLMGGSLALELKTFPDVTSLLGFDRNELHQSVALSRGLVDAIVPMDTILSCDIVILAIPVEGIVSLMPQLASIPSTTTLIDLGSTKEKIITAIPPAIRKNFVAAHPMTGTEFSGPTAAFLGLYTGKTVVLCDIDHSGTRHAERALSLFKHLGMNIVFMNGAAHDRHAAFISHMPHVISYALANTVLEQEEKNAILTLAAGGFRDMSRLAKSSPQMWQDIFKQNKKHLLDSLDLFENHLLKAKNMVENDEWEALKLWMEEAGQLHKIM